MLLKENGVIFRIMALIYLFIGMFGHGKTLSMTHKARLIYKQFGDSVLFISNYKLFGIPYVPLKNFNQLLEIGADKEEFYSDEDIKNHNLPDFYYNEDNKIKLDFCVDKPCYVRYYDIIPFTDEKEDLTEEEYLRRLYDDQSETVSCEYTFFNDLSSVPDVLIDDIVFKKRVIKQKYQGYVVLIDEIEDVLSHRNFASFPLQLLNVLTQQRKKHVYIMASAQRFFMVDKIFRGITTHIIDCNKFWRFQQMKYFDAWDYENAMNSQLVRPLSNRWFFVKNKDFNAYSTEQMITEDMSSQFISNDEKLAKLGLDNIVNEQAIKHPSRALKRKIKGKK